MFVSGVILKKELDACHYKEPKGSNRQIHEINIHNEALYLIFYDKKNPTRFLMGSYLRSIVAQTHRLRHHCQSFAFLSQKTNIFHLVLGLYSNGSQETLKLADEY